MFIAFQQRECICQKRRHRNSQVFCNLIFHSKGLHSSELAIQYLDVYEHSTDILTALNEGTINSHPKSTTGHEDRELTLALHCTCITNSKVISHHVEQGASCRIRRVALYINCQKLTSCILFACKKTSCTSSVNCTLPQLSSSVCHTL